MPLDAISATLLTTAALMFVALIRRVRQGHWPRARRELRRRWVGAGRPGSRSSTARLPPTHRRAWNLANRAVPDAMLLPRLGLHRLVIQAQASKGASAADQVDWRGLSADLVVRDPLSKKQLVVLIQAGEPSDRRRKRLEQTREVLLSAGIPVSVWQQDALPTLAAVREQFSNAGISKSAASAHRRRSRPRGFDIQTQPSTLV